MECSSFESAQSVKVLAVGMGGACGAYCLRCSAALLEKELQPRAPRWGQWSVLRPAAVRERRVTPGRVTPL